MTGGAESRAGILTKTTSPANGLEQVSSSIVEARMCAIRAEPSKRKPKSGPHEIQQGLVVSVVRLAKCSDIPFADAAGPG